MLLFATSIVVVNKVPVAGALQTMRNELTTVAGDFEVPNLHAISTVFRKLAPSTVTAVVPDWRPSVGNSPVTVSCAAPHELD